LVFAAAGNVDHEQILGLIHSLEFSSQTASYSETLAAPAQAAPIFVEQRPDLEQAHLIIATPMVSARDPRRYAADLLGNALGGGTSSRLWQKIREDRGLAYSVGAATAMYNDTGFFTVTAATSPEQTGEVLDITIEEMGIIARDGISQNELDLMKEQTRASILLALEDSAGRAGSLAQSEMVHGRQITIEESLANLAAVTTEEIQVLAREFFRSEKLAFVALGDLDGLKVDRDRLTI
jgi:predicted Zn-dependent peptidase